MGADAEQEGPRGRRKPGRAPDGLAPARAPSGLRADSALGLQRPLPAAAPQVLDAEPNGQRRARLPAEGEAPGFRGPTGGGGRGEAVRAPLQDSRARAHSGPGGSTPRGLGVLSVLGERVRSLPSTLWTGWVSSWAGWGTHLDPWAVPGAGGEGSPRCPR